jgi:signal transduction histidine kinase
LAAHYLNNLEVEELRSNLQLSIHLLPYPSEGTLLERLDAARTLPDGALVQIGTDDHLEAIGLVTMTDPLDNPSVIVAVKHDSAIIEQGQLTILYFAVSFLAVISLLAFVILVIVDQQILSRVARLRVRVSDLQRSAATTAPVRLSGNDEIAQFSNALEDLLETLAQANRDTAQARDEAVKALAAKTHLLANVSHDARTPLTVILLRAEMLLTERFGALTERQREMIIGVQASGKQMLFFINNLLVTAKLAADSFWLHEKSFEIQGFINEIEHFVIPLCQMQGVTLETRCASDMPLQVVADREYLKQLTFNLLDNAIKSAAGKVWLTVTRIDARYWCIQVKDNGKGISESEIMYIFDGLYHDGDKSRPKTQSTNGMGLAVVKQLSEIMNGRVNVTSDAGTGTTFVVTLPFR